MNVPNISVGDRVRVLVDHPYSTDFLAGDLLTVEGTSVMQAGPGIPVPVVHVTAPSGKQARLGLDAVEVYNVTIAPAQRDELYDAFFQSIIRSDVELMTVAQNAGRDLADHDEAPEVEQPRGVLTDDDDYDDDDDADYPEDPGPPWKVMGPESKLTYTDPYGDIMDLRYGERPCPEHGHREGAFLIETEGTQLIIPVQMIQPLVDFFLDRAKFFLRPETDGTV